MSSFEHRVEKVRSSDGLEVDVPGTIPKLSGNPGAIRARANAGRAHRRHTRPGRPVSRGNRRVESKGNRVMSERMETNEVSPPDGLPMEQLFVPA